MQDQQHAIDLTRYHFKHDIGDLSIYGTWLWNGDKEGTEPALVVIPRYRLTGVRPCVVALSAAHKYNDARYAVHAARRFAQEMGFEDSMTNTRKIAELIHDHLLDLIKMPPDPRKAVVVGEATVDTGSGRKQTLELLDHEQVRQA